MEGASPGLLCSLPTRPEVPFIPGHWESSPPALRGSSTCVSRQQIQDPRTGAGGAKRPPFPPPPCLLTSLCCCQAGEGCGGGHRSESRNQHHGFTNRERDPPAGSAAGLASAPAGPGGCRGSRPSQPRAGWASGPGRVQPARGQVQRPSRSRSRPRGPSRAAFSSLVPPASRFSPPGLFFSSLCSWA